MATTRNRRFARNYGFWSEKEQQALLESDVALAGVGGDGYLLGLSLARMGVGRFRIADPEVFELENINRVPGATESNVGRRKVDCFLQDARSINSAIEIDVYPEGVSSSNVERFLRGADLVVDETELTRPEFGVMIADAAVAEGIVNLQVMNIGFAGQVTAFDPARPPGFRQMIGVDRNTPLEQVAETGLDLTRVLPFLPEYVDVAVLEAVLAGAPLPSIVQGVNVAAAIGSSQAFLHLTSHLQTGLRPDPVWFPQMLYVDALTGESRRSFNVEMSHRASLEKMVANTAGGLVTPLTYPLIEE